MSAQSESVKKWRKKVKEKLVEAAGGQCILCGYKKYKGSLAFHHLDPSKKDFSFGQIRANCKNWKSIVEEVMKCVLLCHNCHNEIHGGITTLDKVQIWNQEILNPNKLPVEISKDKCSCGNEKLASRKFCSRKCFHLQKGRLDWSKIDLIELLKSHSIIELAKKLGCSTNAIHKKLKRLGFNH